ncbi:MAG: hypothetical protein F6K10_35440 [Moorea sp. SIO2B7]|uniref:Uncharacterized protein n=1 Tax=Moorena producens 3L TaxID=489825 RepID=F4XIN2_9CYAN|nr:hypothetical protein LYNGBM3L_03190 [Moorena producens 3L]NES86239.1 hypothetical protein [Moorena sp. SIO2B7]OLT68901.1 hypothetical protein BI334_31285 [Moorena producens 3L]
MIGQLTLALLIYSEIYHTITAIAKFYREQGIGNRESGIGNREQGTADLGTADLGTGKRDY